MSDLIKQADECRKLLRGFQAFAEVANALESVGSLQQAEKEAKKSLESLTNEISEAQKELVAAKAKTKKETEALQIKLDGEMKLHNEEIQKTIEFSRKKAESINADSLAKQQVAQDAVNRLQGDAIVLADQIKTATEALATLQANVAKVQAQANKLLGA
jgi:hypothetical protein